MQLRIALHGYRNKRIENINKTYIMQIGGITRNVYVSVKNVKTITFGILLHVVVKMVNI